VSELDLLGLPLSGHSLVEANAGTGKTYSITAIQLRLILEQDWNLEEILVMTFTRAATAELKKGLRERLHLARRALSGEQTKDDFVEQLIAGLADQAEARRRVERSLQVLDLAPVLTIHGFCQQVLSRFAFQSGWDPDRDLVERENDHLKEQVQIAWENLAAGFSPEFAACVRKNRGDMAGLLERITRDIIQQAERPWREVIPPRFDSRAQAEMEAEGRRLTGKLVAFCAAHEGELEEILTSPVLKRGTYSDKRIEIVRTALRAVIHDPGDWLSHAPLLEHLGTTRLESGTKVREQPPEHAMAADIDRLVALAGELKAGLEIRKSALWFELYEPVLDARDRIKQRLGIRSYNDLVADLAKALEGEGGKALAENIRDSYPVALIDEFQDTDLLQFEIFDRIYADSDDPVVYVGDPKQALYAFRGADVHAYLKARNSVGKRFELSRNWRSRPALLAGVNALFEQTSEPFITEQIKFKPSSCADPERHRPLLVNDLEAEPFSLWLVTPEGRKDALRMACAGLVANDIVSLLAKARAGEALIDDQPLQARDICVLVRKHDQADLVAAALERANLGCSRTGRESIWSGVHAQELSRLLHGISNCERPGQVAAALSTRWCGLDAAELARIQADESLVDRHFLQFAGYRNIWAQSGLSAALARVLADFDTAGRSLADSEGERSLTNFYHLQDLLTAHENESGRSITGLLEWLDHQRQHSKEVNEDNLLRLESDESLVQVMTIHKAKGLEFPVVYCPYLWDSSSSYEIRTSVEYHDEEGWPVLDLGGPDMDAHRELALAEAAAEDQRMLYVALTRAKQRGVAIWCPHTDARYNPFRYLLHARDESGWRRGLERYAKLGVDERMDEAEEVLAGWGIAATRRSVDEADQPLEIESLESRAGVTPLGFEAKVPSAWQITSYSALMSDHGSGHAGADSRDHDPLGSDAELMEDEQGQGIFDLPGGPTVGLMFHDLFENLPSFDPGEMELEQLVARKLEQYGQDPAWLDTVVSQTRECLKTPLDSGDDPLTLSRLAPEQRLAEMEFYLGLGGGNLARIMSLIRPPGSDAPKGPVPMGFLRGFIDLIFVHDQRYFVVDYKSNRLGTALDDYRPEALKASVESAGYDLQYHLYAVALHRLLVQQLKDYQYDRNFGGVYYLYLRGMRAATGPTRGVHYHRPEQSTIEALEAELGQ
jgi:exodeoxyribonuclease V beta subunit